MPPTRSAFGGDINMLTLALMKAPSCWAADANCGVVVIWTK
jgi:hypothetical protein